MRDEEFKAALREQIGIAVGEASMCWTPPPGSQVFDSTRASKVVDDLTDAVLTIVQNASLSATESAKPERKWPLKSCIELGPNCRCPECELCGQPMPEGEEMFKYHGYSGPCPTPPKKAEKEFDAK